MLIQLNNSNSKIEGFSLSQFTELRRILSYTLDPKSTYFSGFKGKQIRYLIDKNGNFPTGLWSRVENYIITRGITARVKNNRKIPKGFVDLQTMKDIPSPYPEQLEACKAALRAHRGIISMPTGTGKSFTMGLLVQELKVKTLIVVPSLELKHQLTQSFNQWFRATPHIKIENIDSPKLKDLKNFDCLIIDEAHRVAAKTYRQLNKFTWNNIYYRFFFTATPFRNKEEEMILFESIAGQLVYELNYTTAIAKKYIVPLHAYYLELPKRKVEGNVWPQVYKELVVENKKRNELIAALLTKLKIENISTLCLVKEIKHGEIIKELTGIPFAHGENDETSFLLSEFSSGKIPCLIATASIAGEGCDTKAAEYMVLAGLGKSKPQFMQNCGRILRRFNNKENGKVILFKDPSHKFTLSHFKTQVKILEEEYNIKCLQLS